MKISLLDPSEFKIHLTNLTPKHHIDQLKFVTCGWVTIATDMRFSRGNSVCKRAKSVRCWKSSLTIWIEVAVLAFIMTFWRKWFINFFARSSISIFSLVTIVWSDFSRDSSRLTNWSEIIKEIFRHCKLSKHLGICYHTVYMIIT